MLTGEDTAMAPLVEILGGGLQDDIGDYCVLATMQPVVSVGDWRYSKERGKLPADQAKSIDIRCSPPAALGRQHSTAVRSHRLQS